MILGKNLILAIGNTPLAASKSCRVSKSKSFIEVASPTASAWESFIPSKKGWSMSADCLIGTMEAYKTLDAAWKNDTALTIRFYNTEYDENETGTAYIENLELTASNGSLATMSVSLKGSGELSEYGGTDIALTFQAGTQQGYYYISNGTAYYDDHQQGDLTAEIYKFTLSKRSKVRLYMDYCECAIFTKDADIIEELGHSANFSLQSLNAQAYNNSTDIMLDAGTWYVLFSSDDAQGMEYNLTNLS